MMKEYLCNACGFEFTEEEAYKDDHTENLIICPMCEAERWDDDDSMIVEINASKEEEEE